MKKKVWLSVAAIALVLCCAIGGTLAWLSAKTDPVKNTFTVGDINIDLTETTGETYKMVPGNTLGKDPKVTVKAGSEACWLFVKVDKSANFDTFMTYAIADGWTALSGVDGVYYRDVTKQQLQAVTGSLPTMTFTAYAVQQDNIADAATAWAKITP